MFKSLFGLINQPVVETNATAELTPETPLEKVRVELKNGQVKLRNWEHPWVQANVHVQVSGTFAEELRDGSTDRYWKLEQRGTEALFVQADYPWATLGAIVVDVELFLPPGLEARVETHNGSVEVEQFAGAIRAHTHNGAVRLYDVTAPVDLSTHNGKIEATRITGALRLLTHNGAIFLEDVHGEVRAETHNGKIEATDCHQELMLETHNGAIRLRNRHEMNYDVKLRTSNGSISMDIPRNASARLEMKTSLGGIKGDALPVRGSGISQKMEATLGEGKHLWQIRTDKGPIVIEYAN